MAEFRFVMKQWRRMCDDERCDKCILKNFCDADPCSMHDSEINVIEDIVLKWAEKHPEPIYPSFLVWLHKMYPQMKGMSDFDVVLFLLETKIPDDIAQKLGLEPKEG